MRKRAITSCAASSTRQKRLRVVGVVGRVHGVLIERHAVRDLAGHGVDGDGNAEFVRARSSRRRRIRPPASACSISWRKCPSLVRSHSTWSRKSKSICETARAVGDRRGGQPARGHVERDVPGMIEPRRQRQADLAGDLRPQMQRRGGVLPRGIGQCGPAFGSHARHHETPGAARQ